MAPDAAPSSGSAFSVDVGLADWRCRLTVEAPGREAEASPLFQAQTPWNGAAESAVTLTLREGFSEIRWLYHGEPGDLGLLFRSPEGRRFIALPTFPEPTYSDAVLGALPALAVSNGALRVLHSEQWTLYLELVLTWLLLREGQMTSLHAAVCVAEETVLVLIGASGSGKSTLAAALSAAGADFYSDESVFFHGPSGRLFVQSRLLGLRPGGLGLLTAPPAGDWHEAKPNDPKCAVSLPTPKRSDLPEKARFYFLEGFGPAPLLQPAPAGEMTLRLMRGMGHGDPSLTARLDAAAEIATRFPGWKLTLGSPEETARMLAAHSQTDA